MSADKPGKRLGVTGRCIRIWHQEGIIPSVFHVGKVIRFREADVMAALEKASGPSEEAKNVEDLVRWALCWVVPDVAEQPSWLLMRDPTDAEVKQTVELAALFFQKMQEVGTREERQRGGAIGRLSTPKTKGK